MESLSKIAAVCFRDGASTREQYHYRFDERPFVTIANLYRVRLCLQPRTLNSHLLPKLVSFLATTRRNANFIKPHRGFRVEGKLAIFAAPAAR